MDLTKSAYDYFKGKWLHLPCDRMIHLCPYKFIIGLDVDCFKICVDG